MSLVVTGALWIGAVLGVLAWLMVDDDSHEDTVLVDTPLDDVKYPPVEGRSVAPWDDATYRVVVYRLHDSCSSTSGEGMDYDEMEEREDHHDHEEFEDVRRRKRLY